MHTFADKDPFEGEVYLAGELVAPGIYRQIGGWRELHLDHADYLPASMDGHVACYRLVQHTWGQMRSDLRGDSGRPAESTRLKREVPGR